jgi:hypothetical protein
MDFGELSGYYLRDLRDISIFVWNHDSPEYQFPGGSGDRRVARRLENSAWLKAGKSVATSAVAWSEFCNGPLSKAQKDAAFAVLDRQITDFTWRAAAIVSAAPLATFNAENFQRLVPFGLRLEG